MFCRNYLQFIEFNRQFCSVLPFCSALPIQYRPTLHHVSRVSIDDDGRQKRETGRVYRTTCVLFVYIAYGRGSVVLCRLNDLTTS